MTVLVSVLGLLLFAAGVFVRFVRPVGRHERAQLSSISRGCDAARAFAEVANRKQWLSACEWRLAMREAARLANADMLRRAGIVETTSSREH